LKEVPLRCLALVKGNQLGVSQFHSQILRFPLRKPEKRRRKRASLGPLKIRIPKMEARCWAYLRKLSILTAVEGEALTGVKVSQNL
jgi:hypothetical protein